MLFLILHLICLSLVFILTVWRLERGGENLCEEAYWQGAGSSLTLPAIARIFIYICMCSSFSLGLGMVGMEVRTLERQMRKLVDRERVPKYQRASSDGSWKELGGGGRVGVNGLVWQRREQTREYWIIYRGPGFLVEVWFGSRPPPLHLRLSRQ